MGRDILIGAALGVIANVFGQFGRWLPSLLGKPAEPLWIGTLLPYLGARYVVADLAAAFVGAIFFSIVVLFLLFIVRLVTRSQAIAVVAVTLLLAASGVLESENLAITVVLVLAANVTVALAISRFGLVSAAVMMLFLSCMPNLPLASHTSAWYSSVAMIYAAVSLGIALLGFYTSLGGRPMFGRLSSETG